MSALLLLLYSLLLILLIISSIEDFKTNNIALWKQGAIILTSSPLIYLNWHAVGLTHALVIIFMLLLCFGMGAADAKIMIPLSLTLQAVPLLLFMLAWAVVGLYHGVITRKINIPMVPAITIAWVIVAFLFR